MKLVVNAMASIHERHTRHLSWVGRLPFVPETKLEGSPMPRAVIPTSRFLKKVRIARLATVDGRGRPHIVPIVFVYAEGILYTPIDLKPKAGQPKRLRRVRNLLSNPHVQVLVDHYDEDWRRLGYVQLRGRAKLIEHGTEYRRAIGLLEGKYHQYKELPLEGRPVIKISIDQTVTWGRIM